MTTEFPMVLAGADDEPLEVVGANPGFEASVTRVPEVPWWAKGNNGNLIWGFIRWCQSLRSGDNIREI